MDFTIREATINDSLELYNIRQMPKVMENILSYKDEPKNRIKTLIESKGTNDYWYVSEFEERVIGLIILKVHGNPRKCHVGCITIMVNSDFHSKGVGSMLMKHVMNLADNELNLKRLELSVFKDNERGIGLYKKFGFEVEGSIRMSALRNEVYADEYAMARIK
ncbi:MAG TPA: GNAT family N-acetyltransferase [Clostridium sp.]|uniref:GNAT family N-acetyltransferase n=1 Tax=Clostridium sp. TaxID=1506 RepID=UPI002F93427A